HGAIVALADSCRTRRKPAASTPPMEAAAVPNACALSRVSIRPIDPAARASGAARPATRGAERVLDAAIAAVCAFSLLAHVASTLVAVRRCRPPRRSLPPPAAGPKVAVLRPVCGIDSCEALTLRATFALDYPRLQLIFCCERPSDPAAQLVAALLR